VPLPVPELVVVSQLTLLVADHAQPEPAVTVKDPLPAVAATDAELDDSEYEQVVEAVIVKGTLPNWVVLLPTLSTM